MSLKEKRADFKEGAGFPLNMSGLKPGFNEFKSALLYLAVALVIFLVRNQPFFWDTIQLASKHGHFFYETNFRSMILPEVIDSGHPPVFGMYMAAIWKIFGKTLSASHFAMLPFLWGIVFFLVKTGEKLVNMTAAPWLVLLCFADPVLAGQSVLVSPDVVLVCFFLMGLWAVLEGKAGWLTLAVTGLGLISMRGMMVGVSLYLFSVLISEKIDFQQAIKRLPPFLPGGLLAAAWLFYHWKQTGWIGYHENSTWAPSFERVGMQGFIKNIAVLGWRMLDFGRLFIWVALAVAGFYFLKKNAWNWPVFVRKNTGWQLVILFVITLFVLVPSQLLHKGLLAHRYLLPVFIPLNFVAYYLIFKTLDEIRGTSGLLLMLLIAGFASGNFWIYPKKISQGWDSTLAHLPWYRLQEQAVNFIQASGIPFSSVGTAFPNIGPKEVSELNGVGEGFHEKDLSKDCYVLYSNIMNDFSDEEIDELETAWRPVFSTERRGVCVILYKNSNPEKCEN